LAARPDNVGALCRRGAVLRRLQRFDEAISSYRRTLAIDPGHSDALSALRSLGVDPIA
jgi:hypothetical protein